MNTSLKNAQDEHVLDQDQLILWSMDLSHRFLEKILKGLQEETSGDRFKFAIANEDVGASPKACAKFVTTFAPKIIHFLMQQDLSVGQKALEMALRSDTLECVLHTTFPSQKRTRAGGYVYFRVEDTNDLLTSFEEGMEYWLSEAQSYAALHQKLETELSKPSSTSSFPRPR